MQNPSQHSPSARHQTLGRWQRLIIRATIAALSAWLLATTPLPHIPPQTWVAYIQVPIVIFLLICYLGKLLIDTFFYNHYPS